MGSSETTAPARRLAVGHMLHFLMSPGNARALGGRVARRALGREVVVPKAGGRVNAASIAQWVRAAGSMNAGHFASIDEHRRRLAAGYRDQVMLAVDRRHAAEMSVSDRAIAVSLPDEDGRVLYELIRSQGFSRCLEMGGAFGVGTRYMALALHDNGGGNLWTIELEAMRQALAVQALGDLGRYVHPETGRVEDVIPRLAHACRGCQFYFVDALHTEEATWGYYELIRRYTHGPVFCVFHDVNSSGPMAKVWRRIVAQGSTLEAAAWRRLGVCVVQGEAQDA